MLQKKMIAVDMQTMLSVIRHEKKKEVQKAATVLLDWLLDKDRDNPEDVLHALLDALRSGTAEHLHVHNVVRVSSVYLPVHQHLVTVLADTLRDGTLSVSHLLHFLQQFRLLEPERAPQVLNMAQRSDDIPEEERHVQVATYLLACLYSNQAKVLLEMQTPPEGSPSGSVSENTLALNISAAPQDRFTTSPRDERSLGSPDDVEGSTDAHKDVDLADHREGNADWIDQLTTFIADSLSERPNAAHLVGDTASGSGVEHSSTAGVGTSAAEDGGRLDEILASWTRQRGELWPLVLQRVLEGASGRTGPWGHSALDPSCLRSLWNTAAELIRREMSEDTDNTTEETSENGNAQAVSAEDNASDAGSSASTETVREVDATMLANLDRSKQETVKKYVLESSKLHEKNLSDDLIVPPDDSMSLISEENNSRQLERGMGVNAVTSGVLREEEAKRLKEGPIQLRPYQDELLTSARNGNNVLIMLPTGTGKTYIVLKYAEEHLKGGEDRRVGFVVPKVRLARQQFERFQAYLPEFKPHLKCGETSGTAGSRQPLSEVLHTSSVVVMTGQCLVEAVESKKVSLNQFSLLVLDECHHTRGGHPLRSLMNLYMEFKFGEHSSKVKLPQIIGLTASPGVGKARGKVLQEAETYLKQLCARLDVTHICSVRQHLQDLEEYVKEPELDIHECEKRKVDKLKERIEALMQIVEERMFADPDVERYFHQAKQLETPQSSEQLKKQLQAPVTQRGEDQYTQWLSTAEKAIKEVDNQKALYALTAHINMLQHCQRCLILNEDCDSLGALQLLKEEVDSMRREKHNKEQVDQELFGLFERHTDYKSNEELPSLQYECARKECQNPKLKYLEELLLKVTQDDQTYEKQLEISSESAEAPGEKEAEAVEREATASGIAMAPTNVEAASKFAMDERNGEEASEVESSADTVESTDCLSMTDSEWHHLDDNVRGMIFVRTLDLSKALLRWMERHPKLKSLIPGRITGVNASVKNGGMTKSEVTEVMAKFNAGIHKVVICTSAAEEGLDFKACNLVIRYLYEASMVSMVQTRGRARELNSRYCVMGRQSSDSTAKERDNIQSEQIMRDAVKQIQEAVDRDPKAHTEAIQALQTDNWKKRWRKDVQDAKRLRQQLPEGMYRLICRGCGVPACTSQNIRLLKRTNRVVLGAEFSNKYDRRDDDFSQQKAYDASIPRTGKLHCLKCGDYWGIMVRSVDDGVEFPVIPIKSFITEDSDGKRQLIDKWSQAFSVPEITDEDRQWHCEPLLSDPTDRLEGDFEREDDDDTAQDEPSNDLSGVEPLSEEGAASEEDPETHTQPSPLGSD
ncbi:hypothetical protein V1264_023519 [Littorina saxatilis]